MSFLGRTNRMKIPLAPLSAAAILAALVSCGPKPEPGRPPPLKRPSWSRAKAAEAIRKMAGEYRKDPIGFWQNRTYVWSGTWIWPETIGIGPRHMELMEEMFYEGDEATREIILNVILMNIPPEKIKEADKDFLRDLVILDTDIKERRANVPPPSEDEEIIEEPTPRGPSRPGPPN